MASTLTYKQTDCIYNPKNQYIWIKFDNGVNKKGISFVSDGVIFDSNIIGMSSTTDYENIISIRYQKQTNDFGYLVIQLRKAMDEIETEEIGLIEYQCWLNLKEITAANPLSQHIEVVNNEE